MKRYDRAYFDRWYRDPSRRVVEAGEVGRKAAMVIGVAEYLLGREGRTVLDVGCGEATWEPAVRRLRPAARYLGLDPSGYAVRRFGATRNVRRGHFGTLADDVDAARMDVIVCCDVLHYLDARELARGLGQLCTVLDGVAYLDAFTAADDFDGDRAGWRARTPSVYRRFFERAGLVQCAPHCYVARERAARAAALELPA